MGFTHVSIELAFPADYAVWLAAPEERIPARGNAPPWPSIKNWSGSITTSAREILERQTRQGWGAKVIDRLASDLREAFPGDERLLQPNLKYMSFLPSSAPICKLGSRLLTNCPGSISSRC